MITNGNFVLLPGAGELFVSGDFSCCDVAFPWTPISDCNGELSFQDGYITETDYFVCAGESLFVAGEYYSEEDSYTDTLTNAAGCDSILISHLTIAMTDSVFTTATICADDVLVLDAGSAFDSYLWSDGANIQTFTVSDSGWYTVTVTDHNGWAANDSVLGSVDVCVHINKPLIDLGIRVYPNPSSGCFYIESAHSVDVKIYSIDGKPVRSINNLTGIQEVELTHSGMYLIRFYMGNELVSVYRIVVEG